MSAWKPSTRPAMGDVRTRLARIRARSRSAMESLRPEPSARVRPRKKRVRTAASSASDSAVADAGDARFGKVDLDRFLRPPVQQRVLHKVAQHDGEGVGRALAQGRPRKVVPQPDTARLVRCALEMRDDDVEHVHKVEGRLADADAGFGAGKLEQLLGEFRQLLPGGLDLAGEREIEGAQDRLKLLRQAPILHGG